VDSFASTNRGAWFEVGTTLRAEKKLVLCSAICCYSIPIAAKARHPSRGVQIKRKEDNETATVSSSSLEPDTGMIPRQRPRNIRIAARTPWGSIVPLDLDLFDIDVFGIDGLLHACTHATDSYQRTESGDTWCMRESAGGVPVLDNTQQRVTSTLMTMSQVLK
jgi:hypothetical protein